LKKYPAQTIKVDALLEPLLQSLNEQQAENATELLISLHLGPVIKRVISYKLHLSFHYFDQKSDADDLYQEVLVQLLAELRLLRQSPPTHPIGDVRGLAAVIAYRTCAAWMRRQFPERHALKSRLYYVLTRQEGLAIWQTESGSSLVGFAVWRNRSKTAKGDRIAQLRENRALVSELATFNQKGRREGLADLLASIFNLLGAPVDFDELHSLLIELLQIRDQPIQTSDFDIDAVAVSANEPNIAWRVEKRIFLQRLWEEVRQLPANQRAALLLNLRDSEGRDCISLFSLTGIASLDEIAAVLEMTAENFAALWKELPLEDARIAQMLGVTRQKVINARKSGRERLTRRLKGFI